MSLRVLVSIFLISFTSAPSSQAAAGYGLPIITCDIEFQFSMCKSTYTKQGRKLKSAPYARYGDPYIEYHGDSLPFHANGLYMPNIQPEFLASVFFSIAPGGKQPAIKPEKQQANNTLEVAMKLFDNRRNGSGSVEETVLFAPNTEFTIGLAITNQDNLWFERKSADDRLQYVSLTCRRAAL